MSDNMWWTNMMLWGLITVGMNSCMQQYKTAEEMERIANSMEALSSKLSSPSSKGSTTTSPPVFCPEQPTPVLTACVSSSSR